MPQRDYKETGRGMEKQAVDRAVQGLGPSQCWERPCPDSDASHRSALGLSYTLFLLKASRHECLTSVIGNLINVIPLSTLKNPLNVFTSVSPNTYVPSSPWVSFFVLGSLLVFVPSTLCHSCGCESPAFCRDVVEATLD